MGMLSGEQSKTMLFKTGEEEKMEDKEDKEHEFEDLEKEMKKAGAELTERMEEASALLEDLKSEDNNSYNTLASQKTDLVGLLSNNNPGETLARKIQGSILTMTN
jgi:hypothetical protein